MFGNIVSLSDDLIQTLLSLFLFLGLANPKFEKKSHSRNGKEFRHMVYFYPLVWIEIFALLILYGLTDSL
jgi:hypothetical protein